MTSKSYSIHALFEAAKTVRDLRTETRDMNPSGGRPKAFYYLQRARMEIRGGPLLHVLIPILRRHGAPAHRPNLISVVMDEELKLRVVFEEPADGVEFRTVIHFNDALAVVRDWLVPQESLEGVYVPMMPMLLPQVEARQVEAILKARQGDQA